MSPILIGWQPIRRPPRVPLLVCWQCHARELNEHNRLHRGGWMEHGIGRHRVYLCGECAAVMQ